MFEGEPFREILAQPSLGTRKPVEMSQVVTIFLMSFTASSSKWFSRNSQRWTFVEAEPRACKSKRSWFRFFSRTMAVPWHPRIYPTHFGMVSAHAGRGSGHWAGFGSSRDTQHLPASLPTPGRSGPCPPEPQGWCGNKSPERGRCRRHVGMLTGWLTAASTSME